MYKDIEMVESLKGLTKNIIAFFESNFFKDGDISCSELNVIKTIKQEENKQLNITELATLLKMSKSAVSQTIAKLEKKNLVKKKICLFDKKLYYIVLTAKGEIVYKEQSEKYMEAILRVSKEMGNDDSKELSRLVEKLSAIIEKLGKEI